MTSIIDHIHDMEKFDKSGFIKQYPLTLKEAFELEKEEEKKEEESCLSRRSPSILILGHGEHGKDTVAEFIQKHTGMNFESSSMAAARIFLFDELKEKYGYKTFEECYEDRRNRRDEWHDRIAFYNKDDKARLAKEILKISSMYVGMRSDEECQECLSQGLFDYVIGVFDPRKPLEPKSSFKIDMFAVSDFIICNNSTLEVLENRTCVLTNALISSKVHETVLPYIKLKQGGFSGDDNVEGGV